MILFNLTDEKDELLEMYPTEVAYYNRVKLVVGWKSGFHEICNRIKKIEYQIYDIKICGSE